MAKAKRHYLIKEWNESRGTTEDNPSCFWCGGYITKSLEDVKLYLCYTSPKRAQNAALKQYSHSFIFGYKYSVVDAQTGNTVSAI